MKKILQVFLLILTTIVLTGCFGPSPDRVVTDFFSAIKEGNFDTAANYIKSSNSNEEFREKLEKAQDIDDQKLAELLFSKLSWEIISTSKDQNTAEVKTKVTSIDMVRVFTEVMNQIMPLAFASAFDENSSEKIEELTDQYFMNAISDPDAPTITSEVTVKLVKEEGKWLIEPDDDLLNAMTGNAGKLAELFEDEEKVN